MIPESGMSQGSAALSPGNRWARFARRNHFTPFFAFFPNCEDWSQARGLAIEQKFKFEISEIPRTFQ